MADARDGLRQNGVSVIYGTIRLVQRDEESFLAWAREPYACVIFNLHTVHTAEGIARSAESFRNLIDSAIRGCVDLYYIDGTSGADLLARIANTAGLRRWRVR